jgi:hypothetical protein
MNLRRAFLIGGLAILFIAPLFVFAWVPGDPIFPSEPACGVPAGAPANGPYYQGADLVLLINNLVSFSVFLTTAVATLMFAYAGFLYVTAAARTENLQKAKSVFTSVLVGFVLVLTAVLIVNLVLSVLTGKGFEFWTDINCTDYPTINDAQSRTVSPGGISGGATSSSCTTCVAVPAAVECATRTAGQECYIDSSTAEGLAQLQEIYGDEWQLTEDGIPDSGVAHGRICHQSGTCGDANFTGDLKEQGDNILQLSDSDLETFAAEVVRFQDAAKQAGLYAEYEVRTQAEKNRLVAAGVPADEIFVYPPATASHFSILQCKPSRLGSSCND